MLDKPPVVTDAYDVPAILRLIVDGVLSVIIPLVAVEVIVKLVLELILPFAFIVPVTANEDSVPTEVRLLLTIPDPNVVEFRALVPLIL